MPKKHNQKTKTKQVVRGFLRPPPFKANFQVKHRFRFVVTVQVASSITRKDLLNLIFINAVTTTQSRIFSAVKLNRVEIWAVAGSGSNDFSTANISMNWLSNYGPNTEVSDSGNAFNTAHITTSPPRQSLASFWSLTGSNETEALFFLSAPVGAIVDVWVDATLFDGAGAAFTTNGSGSGSFLYFGYLDYSSSKQIQPVSVAALT